MTHSDHAVTRDRELLAAVGRGTALAFETIYRDHKDGLLTVAYHMLGDMNAAEDVLQDVFVTLASKASQVRLRGSLRSYLLTSTLNRCRDQRRRAKANHAVASSLELDVHPLDTPAPDARVLELERIETIAGALGKVPDEQREVVILHVFEELTFREIAELLAIPSNTAQSRYRYAMVGLRDRLTAKDIQR